MGFSVIWKNLIERKSVLRDAIKLIRSLFQVVSRYSPLKSVGVSFLRGINKRNGTYLTRGVNVHVHI